VDGMIVRFSWDILEPFVRA